VILLVVKLFVCFFKSIGDTKIVLIDHAAVVSMGHTVFLPLLDTQ